MSTVEPTGNANVEAETLETWSDPMSTEGGCSNKKESFLYMGVSKNRGGPPKWINFIMEHPIKMDDLGVPLFLETHICTLLIIKTWQTSNKSTRRKFILRSKKILGDAVTVLAFFCQRKESPKQKTLSKMPALELVPMKKQHLKGRLACP